MIVLYLELTKLFVPYCSLQPVSIRTTTEIRETTFSVWCYPWYWLTSHKALLLYVLMFVLYVYVYLAILCIVLCKCQSVIPNKTTNTTMSFVTFLVRHDALLGSKGIISSFEKSKFPLRKIVLFPQKKYHK